MISRPGQTEIEGQKRKEELSASIERKEKTGKRTMLKEIKHQKYKALFYPISVFIKLQHGVVGGPPWLASVNLAVSAIP